MTKPKRPVRQPAAKALNTPKKASKPAAARGPMRLAKRIAHSGVASRRGAEALIVAGRVLVDGEIIKSPATNVTPSQKITVDGQVLGGIPAPRLWRLHKPMGFLTTSLDPDDRPTIFNLLPKGLPRLISIGRLDFNSEGLLLLTNDGDLARQLELPKNKYRRIYRVRVHGKLPEKRLANLRKGLRLDGTRYGPIRVTIERQVATNSWLLVELQEGKNREIRKVMAHLGLQVTRLLRIAYGPFQLGTLPKGTVDEIPSRLVEKLVAENPSPRQSATHNVRDDKSADTDDENDDADNEW